MALCVLYINGSLVVLTNPPLHIGETLCASHTSALIDKITPNTTLRTPNRKCTPEVMYMRVRTRRNILRVMCYSSDQHYVDC